MRTLGAAIFLAFMVESAYCAVTVVRGSAAGGEYAYGLIEGSGQASVNWYWLFPGRINSVCLLYEAEGVAWRWQATVSGALQLLPYQEERGVIAGWPQDSRPWFTEMSVSVWPDGEEFGTVLRAGLINLPGTIGGYYLDWQSEGSEASATLSVVGTLTALGPASDYVSLSLPEPGTPFFLFALAMMCATRRKRRVAFRSGRRESNPVYIHPMDAYYRYTTARRSRFSYVSWRDDILS